MLCQPGDECSMLVLCQGYSPSASPHGCHLSNTSFRQDHRAFFLHTQPWASSCSWLRCSPPPPSSQVWDMCPA